MALDNRYIPDISLSEFLIDPATGLPITGGTVEFWVDEDRSQPKNVFQLTGSPPDYTYDVLPNPMNIVSGIPVNENGVNVAIYYFPYDDLGNIQNYYIVVKNEDGTIVNEREAWPNLTATSDPTQTENGITNELDNGQFSDVLFNPQYGRTIVTDGAVSDAMYEIAPRWFLKVSSNDTATILIARVSLEGSLNIETNPPYQLNITPEGGNITSLSLVQRLEHNPDIWASGYVAASLVATSLDGISHTIEGIYAPNISTSSTTIFSETTGATGYVRMEGTQAISAGTNTDNSDIGYVDFIVNLPVIGAVGITSVQIVGLESNQENVNYEQQTVNRQESLLFSYYNPYIQAIPVPSISEGWDFKFNPTQSSNDGAFGPWGGASNYVWDQTIIWQSADNLVSVTRDAPHRMHVATADTGQLALVQYLGTRQLHALLANGWSTLINAYTDNVLGASGTVSFYYTTDSILPSINGANQSLIATMDANGKPLTFHGNWVELPNPLLGQNKFTIPYNAAHTTSSVALNGWAQPAYDIASTATFIAIVVGFSSLPATSIYFDSIAVTPGRLAVPFAPLGYNATLNQLRYYYEKSYDQLIAPGTPSQTSRILYPYAASAERAGPSQTEYVVSSFGLVYKQHRRTNGFLTLYSPNTGTPNTVHLYTEDGASIEISVATGFDIQLGTDAADYFGDNGVIVSGLQPIINPGITFHYVSDARLGIN